VVKLTELLLKDARKIKHVLFKSIQGAVSYFLITTKLGFCFLFESNPSYDIGIIQDMVNFLNNAATLLGL
jgi:hypothetical protein